MAAGNPGGSRADDDHVGHAVETNLTCARRRRTLCRGRNGQTADAGADRGSFTKEVPPSES